MASSKTPHFFKIILSHNLKEGKLEVPKKFVRKYGESLLKNKVCVKVGDDDAKWKVGLEKSDGKVWFEKGWKEFMEFYNIKLGYFLVFRYEGDSCFHVIIFDHSALEIRYRVKKSDTSDEIEESDDEIQILEEISCKRSRDKQIHEGDVSNKKMKMERNKDRLKKKADFEVVKNIKKEYFWSKKKKIPLIPSQASKLMEKANSFKSMTLNPSFVIKICRSSISPGHSMDIPRSFSKMHINKSEDIELEVSNNGRKWSVHCIVYLSPHRAVFSNGWKRFVIDNHLRHGDVCVFELIESTKKILMKVSIFKGMKMEKKKSQENESFPLFKRESKEMRNLEVGDRPNSPLTPNQEAKLMEKAKKFESMIANPSFVIKMWPSYVNRAANITVPVNFTQTHLKESVDMVLQLASSSDIRTWNVCYSVYETRNGIKAELGKGWKIFARETGLLEGDICVFEMIRSHKILSMKVFIFRA